MRSPARSLSGWHPADVKAAIAKKGSTLTALAERYGYDASYLRHALRRPLEDGERIIASYLGEKPQAIWPDRYDAKGRRTVSRVRRAA